MLSCDWVWQTELYNVLQHLENLKKRSKKHLDHGKTRSGILALFSSYFWEWVIGETNHNALCSKFRKNSQYLLWTGLIFLRHKHNSYLMWCWLYDQFLIWFWQNGLQSFSPFQSKMLASNLVRDQRLHRHWKKKCTNS